MHLQAHDGGMESSPADGSRVIRRVAKKVSSGKESEQTSMFRMSYQVSATSHWRTIDVKCSSSYKIASKLFYDMGSKNINRLSGLLYEKLLIKNIEFLRCLKKVKEKMYEISY